MADLLPALNAAPLLTSFPVPKLVQQGGITYEGPKINGQLMPGQWLLTKGGRKFGWQEQQAGFMSGAYLLPSGDPLMPIEYEVRIWEDAAMALFRSLLKTTLKKPIAAIPGSRSYSPLSIHDLALKDMGVTSVVVADYDYPKNPLVTSGGRGAWIGRMAFTEYRKPVPVLPPPAIQTVQDNRAGIPPSASDNVATAGASMAQGDSQRQAAIAARVLPQ